jgi:demethylmenaquinone methyltransferase/2-methoxy-6-polyprenyl-1,4-benzoquinol methylase
LGKRIDKSRYDGVARFYDRFESPLEFFGFARWRRHIFDRIGSLRVKIGLEIGVGTGLNLPFYGEGRYVAFDVSEEMIYIAKARERGKDISLLLADSESLPFRDDTFDIAFSTFVFCSVENPVNGLKETYRVLKTGGKALFLEHMLPRIRILQPVFNLINRFSRKMGDDVSRRTDENIKKANFEMILEENLFLTIFRLIEAKKSQTDTI